MSSCSASSASVLVLTMAERVCVKLASLASRVVLVEIFGGDELKDGVPEVFEPLVVTW